MQKLKWFLYAFIPVLCIGWLIAGLTLLVMWRRSQSEGDIVNAITSTPPVSLEEMVAATLSAVEVAEMPLPTITVPPSLTPAPTETSTPTETTLPTETPIPTAPPVLRFAVIGDFGKAGPGLQSVADMIISWNVDFIITTGDNNYPDGAASTIDENIGQYFHSFIYPYQGSYGAGADTNRFFPSLGNHDCNTNLCQPYLDYFTLPGNERYYDFVWGPVHFFSVNSDSREPDGVGRSTVQGQWFKAALAAASEPWKVVYTHYSPYSSGYMGSTDWIQWPFAEWGASVVLSGHDHVYERLMVDGVPYFVNGLGGGEFYPFIGRHPASLERHDNEYGAMLVEATAEQMTFWFYTVPDNLIDSYTITKGR